jgi:hypothetical protein
MKVRVILSMAVAAVVGLSGCQTDNSGSGAQKVPSPSLGTRLPRDAEMLIPAAKVNAIARGMSADEVRALLGTPEHVQPYGSRGGNAKIWIYNLAVQRTFHQVSSGIREVPAFDPITGASIVVREPIMTNRRVKRYTTLELLMIDDRLMERRPGHSVDVSID